MNAKEQRYAEFRAFIAEQARRHWHMLPNFRWWNPRPPVDIPL